MGWALCWTATCWSWAHAPIEAQPAESAAASPEAVTLSIVGTTDLHGRVFATNGRGGLARRSSGAERAALAPEAICPPCVKVGVLRYQ